MIPTDVSRRRPPVEQNFDSFEIYIFVDYLESGDANDESLTQICGSAEVQSRNQKRPKRIVRLHGSGRQQEAIPGRERRTK